MSNKLAELVVQVSADHAKFATDMQTMQKTAQNSADQISRALGGVHGAVTKIGTAFAAIAAGAGLSKIVQSAADWNLQAAKVARTMGTTTEQASVMNVALSKLGVEQGVAESAALKLSRTLGQGTDKFDKYGVTVKDSSGKLLPLPQIMANVNQKLLDTKAGTDRNIIATQLYGKSWGELQAILKLTPEKMQEAAEMAERLHLVVGPDGVEKSRQYKEKLNEVNLIAKSLSIQLGTELMDAVLSVAKAMSSSGVDGAGAFGKAIKGLVRDIQEAGVYWGSLADKIALRVKSGGGLGRAINVAGVMSPAAAILDSFVMNSRDKDYKRQMQTIDDAAVTQMAEIDKSYQNGSRASKAITGGTVHVGNSEEAAKARKTAADARKAEAEARRKEEELRKAMLSTWKQLGEADQKRDEYMQNQAKELNDLNVQVLELSGSYVKAQAAKEAFERSTPEFKQLEFGAKYGDANAMRKLQLKNSLFQFDRESAVDREAQTAIDYSGFRSSISAFGKPGIETQRAQIEQTYQTRLIEAKKFYKSYHKDMEKFNQDCVAAARERDQMIASVEKQEWEGRLQRIGNMLGEIGNTLMEGNREQFEAGKALAIASAIVNTYMAASSAFAGITADSGGWLTALAATEAAMVVATGMAQVAAIESTQYSPRARGGLVNAGQAYLVGEEGPELMIAGQDGRIIPNNQLGGGQKVEVTNVYQISTGVPETVRAELYRYMPAITAHSVAAVQTAINNGTSLSKAVRRM